MNHPKTFFILPTTIYRPDDFIQLGQVITDPRKPFERLAEPLPLEGALQPRNSPTVEWSATNVRTGETSVGIFAHVVNLITAQASAGQSHNETQTWEAARLETQFFEVSADPTYIERTARATAVEEWLKQHRHLGKTVYMITGLKIAKSPGKVTFGDSDTLDVSAALKATLDPEGAIEGGGEANHHRLNATAQASRPEEAFVYAYRLRKLKVTWRHKFKLDDYMTGAELHGVGGRQDDVEEDEGDGDDPSSFVMEDVSYDNRDFGASLPAKDKKIQAVDEEDNSPCIVIPVAAMKLDG